MDNKTVGGLIGTCISSMGASLSLDDVQTIISIVVTVLGFMITITTTVIIPVCKKIRDAKKDGKITLEELEDINNTVKDSIDKVKEKDND